MFTFKVVKQVRKTWGSSVTATPSRASIRPCLEILEDRTMPSASPVDAQPIIFTASPQAAQAGQALVTDALALIEQRVEQIAAFDQNLIGVVNTVNQVFSQEVSAYEQGLDSILGINPNPQNQSSNAVESPSDSDSGAGRGNSSGSGSGSGATMTHNALNQSLNNSTQRSGNGSGSGSSTTTQQIRSVPGGMAAHPLASPGSGSGSFGIGGSGTGSLGTGTGSGPASVSGQVWLDNNGDGYENNGELGYQGITVQLLHYAPDGSIDGESSTTTDAYGDYSFNLLVGPDPQPYAIHVVFSSVPYVDVWATLRTPDVSQIDGHGTSAVFYLNNGAWREVEAGVVSMDVNTTQDDPYGPLGNNLVTLRDAIETGNNGGGIGHGYSIEPVRFINPSNGQPLGGTINLQAALPDLIASYDIDGPGSSLLAVNANLAPAPLFRALTVRAGTRNINGMTYEGGTAKGDYGGGIYNAATLTLSDIFVYDNKAVVGANGGGDGGGIFNAAGAKLTMDDTHVVYNSAAGYGGGIDNLGTFTSTSSQVYSNSANYGAGIANPQAGGITKLQKNTQDYSNTASRYGGGIYNAGGTVSLSGVSGGYVKGNKAVSGGGIYVSSGKLTLNQSLVYKNTATTGDGGGIYIKNGSVTGKAADAIENNSATNGNGGGIFNFAGTLTLNGLLNSPDPIDNNSAVNGGGMYLAKDSVTTFAGVTVNGNKLNNPATGKGAGIAYENGATMNPKPLGPPALTDNDDPNGPVQV